MLEVPRHAQLLNCWGPAAFPKQGFVPRRVPQSAEVRQQTFATVPVVERVFECRESDQFVEGQRWWQLSDAAAPEEGVLYSPLNRQVWSENLGCCGHETSGAISLNGRAGGAIFGSRCHKTRGAIRPQ